MTASPAIRRAVLALLVLVVVACLGTIALIVTNRAAGDGLGERLRSLKNDEIPASEETEDREELLAIGRDFATRFNTYDPEMLDEQGHLPDYAAVKDLMTAKMGDGFEKYVGLVEATVAQWDAASVCMVYAVGVASSDADSAELLVAGTIQQSVSYASDDRPGQGGDAEEDEEVRVKDDPKDFRYEVSLVKVEGEWLVDDFDDVDDGLPPFSQPAVPEDPALPEQTQLPSDAPSDAPTSEQTQEGER